MKAVFFNEHGAADRLTYGDLPDPEATGTDVLVRVRACAVNHLDVWVRRGLPMLRLKFPFVPGGDISGEVVDVGPGATSVKTGTRVVLNPGVSCSHCVRCLEGKDHLCPEYRILGYGLPGGYAQLVKVPLYNLVPLPEGVGWEDAAALPAVFCTTWSMLFDKARLQPGEWVLVHAGGSGVGSAAIQLARLIGANVITTAGSDEKLEKAAALGAQVLVNYKTQDFLREVRRATGKRGVDVIVEHIGEEVWERSLLSLRTGGRLVTCGTTSGFDARTDLRHVFFRNLEILGNSVGSKASLFRIVRLLAEGKVRAPIDRVLPLREAREAHRLLEARKQFGKVVLLPD
jgi:NADPH:quinone reductase-like Zn-dependent oxidoreductase